MQAQSNVQVISNGSKWLGESPDPIECWFARLEQHPLRFASICFERGQYHFLGNFLEVSAVFRFSTRNGAAALDMALAISANRGRFGLDCGE